MKEDYPFIFSCDPNQDMSNIPDCMKHSHLSIDKKENKMKKKFWSFMWKIDEFNHSHYENSSILWNLFGGWFCNWVSRNDPDTNYDRFN